MGVQAFGVDHTNVEGIDAGGAFQGLIQTACGVFAEHQVLTIGQGEGLFVGAFYCCLNSCTECGFGVVDDGDQRQLVQKSTSRTRNFALLR